MWTDPYFDTGPDLEGDDDAFSVRGDQSTIGRVARDPQTGDWVLTARAPLTFNDVSIPGDYDIERAKSSAVGWIENHVRTERDDLLDDDEDDADS